MSITTKSGPVGWEELVHLTEDNPEGPESMLIKFERHPEVIRQYGDFKGQLQKAQHTVAEYLLGELFGNHQEDYKLAVNNFPYWWEDEDKIDHLVFWIRPGKESGFDHPRVRRLVQEDLMTDKVVVFRNSPLLRTVPEIKHYQVLVRGEEKG